MSGQMRVAFEATVDEVVDVNIRALGRSRVARTWRWQGGVLAALPVGVILYLLVPAAPEERAVFAGLGALLALVLYPSVYRYSVERRLRAFYQEQLGHRDGFPFELEVGPVGVRMKWEGIETLIAWENVDGVQERAGSVDILVRPSGIITVRDRAFDTDADRTRFVELVEHYRDRS